ncbi:MAG TPA: aliphatic sulfonate ABC transporter substrate-binding protein [Roseiflexaceae bacterium]|nr:aliphatic sulfonate ABC transporter substrate-binding protein [Roseiflexaceae bacterium]
MTIALLTSLLLSACGGAAPASAPTAGQAATSVPATGAAGATPAAQNGYPAIQIANKPAAVRIGYQAIPNAELIAKQLGWHEQALGVPVEWRQFESGRDVNTAIAAGAIDIGLVGSSPAASGLAQGLPYDVIAIHDVIGDSEALAAREEIGTIADLKGKKIAAPFGSTTHYSLLQVLKLNGIGPNDVQLIDLNPSDLLAAWNRGDIDAAYIWQPTLQKLYDSGGKQLTASDKVAGQGFPTFDLAVATRQFTAAYPEVVAIYLQNLSKAVDLYRAQPDEALAAIAKELQITPEEARTQAAGLLWLTAAEQTAPAFFGTADAPGALGQSLKTTADFLVEQQVIRTAPDLPVFQKGASPAFLQQAAGR